MTENQETTTEVATRDTVTPEPLKTARFIKGDTSGSGAAWRLYQVTPPMPYEGGHAEFVRVSETTVDEGANLIVDFIGDFGPETYIFPADAEGEVIDWGELDGSFRGGHDHERALRNAGYEVVS